MQSLGCTTHICSSDNTYSNKLLANSTIRDSIKKNIEKQVKLMSNPACELCPKLRLDLHLIEVLNGKSLKISGRKFLCTHLKENDFRKTSPRMFISYDSSVEQDAKFFMQGILNSLSDPEIRVNFLNKFYQFLMADKMSHKGRELVVHGTKNSGKTSWRNVLLGIIPMIDAAFITQELQFAAAMIEEHSQLVVIDEWSEYTLQSDMEKSVLHGAFMVKSVRHKTAKCIENKALFYITTNQLPRFKTSSLQNTCTNADKWMRANCIHCIAWLISEIKKYKKLVDSDEL